jgi:hypothetical protein
MKINTLLLIDIFLNIMLFVFYALGDYRAMEYLAIMYITSILKNIRDDNSRGAKFILMMDKHEDKT